MTGNSRPEISLYFHVPFCTKKCDYCHFYVLPNKPELHTLLAEGFDKEIALRSQELADKQVVSLYFGGGTPSLFGPKAIARVIDQVAKYTPLAKETIEITLEANPEQISQSLMQEYAAVGINRISLGVQSLDEALLKKLSRTHGVQEALQAIERTVQSGISNISIDLMYDIPGQTLETWEQTLKRVETLPITHLSLYNLTIEPHTVFFKYRESLAKELPDQNTSLAMYLTAIQMLSQHGLSQYEISAFARAGLHSRHNIGYWTGRPFLGFGPSAFSYWEGVRFRNIAHIHKYIQKLREGTFPIDFSEQLEPDKMQRELLAIGLRVLEGVELSAFSELEPTIKELETHKLVERAGSKLRLTPRGVLVYDSVASEIV